jgi:voltage-gated potassium channel Kch
MELFLDFLGRFAFVLAYTSPLLVTFILIVSVLGLIVGKREGWTRFEALYFAYITATTVGFGDYYPEQKLSKVLTVLIALLGTVLNGIIIALAIHAGYYALRDLPDFNEVLMNFRK